MVVRRIALVGIGLVVATAIALLAITSRATGCDTCKKTNNLVAVSVLPQGADLTQEEAFVTNFYSQLGLIPQETASAFFSTERQHLQQKNAPVKLLRAELSGILAAVAIIDISKQPDCVYLRRCALDTTQPANTLQILTQALKLFVFSTYPQTKRIANICRKDSAREIALLQSFGFKECALIDATYDAVLYTSFELVNPFTKLI